MNAGLTRLCAILIGAMPAGGLLAQNAPTADGTAGPTEYRLRFTPGMAESISRSLTRYVFVRQYELDEKYIDEIEQAVTRRLMTAAHKLDNEASQEAVERMLAELLEVIADGEGGPIGRRGVPRRLGRAMAEGMVPMLPTLRELIREVGNDLRPKLAGKQQLKLVRDWAAIGAGLETFEKMMNRWAAGDIDPMDNPFRPQANKKDASGQTRLLKTSRQIAERSMQMYDWSQWKRYVTDAKAYYQFDPAQSTTADSVLQETIDRGQRILDDETRRQGIYWNRLWYHLSTQMNLGWDNPVEGRLTYEYDQLMKPIETLGDEMKTRLDSIPTNQQRAAAKSRLAEALAEVGYVQSGDDGQLDVEQQ